MPISEQNMMKLEKAVTALAEAQISILHEEERSQVPEKERQWPRLYSLRVDLNREFHRLKMLGKVSS